MDRAKTKKTSTTHSGKGKKNRKVSKTVVQDKKSSGRDPVTGRFLRGNRISSEPTRWTEEKAMELAEGLVAWMKSDVKNYMIGEYLIQNDLYADVVSYLSGRFPRFADYIARAKEIEASRIQLLALRNVLNPGMAQWVLAVHHNQHNVQKTEVTGKDGTPIAPPSITIQPIAVKQSESDK